MHVIASWTVWYSETKKCFHLKEGRNIFSEKRMVSTRPERLFGDQWGVRWPEWLWQFLLKKLSSPVHRNEAAIKCIAKLFLWFAVQVHLHELCLFMVTHLTLHTFGSASAGAIVGGLSRLRLGLLLQFEVFCVQVLCVSWTLQLLVGLLNTLKKETIQKLFL